MDALQHVMAQMDRASDGNVINWQASAYDTAYELGQDPKYRGTPDDRLPQPVILAFWGLGFEVLEMAKLGWWRARRGWTNYGGLSIKDQMNLVPKERRPARPYRVEADPHYLPPVEETSGDAPAEMPSATGVTVSTKPKGPAYNGPDLRPHVEVCPDEKVLTTSLVAKLPTEVRTLLKECLPNPVDYLGKTVGEVTQHLPFRSVMGNWATDSLIDRLIFETSFEPEKVKAFGKKK